MQDEAIDLFTSLNRGYATVAEMAEPLAVLHNRLVSLINGVKLPVDRQCPAPGIAQSAGWRVKSEE